MKTPLSEKTRDEISAIAGEKGCRLLAVETAGAGRYTVLRLVLERSDGASVSVEDCEQVSREVSPLLDATDEIGHRYTLEVSSAGLDRRLYSLDGRDPVRRTARPGEDRESRDSRERSGWQRPLAGAPAGPQFRRRPIPRGRRRSDRR
jgi:hypothetical protein